MEEFRSLGGFPIKIEKEEYVVKEEYEDYMREELVQEPVVKQESEYGDIDEEMELQLPMLVTLPDCGFLIKEETLEDPLSGISPISDPWIDQESVLCDPKATFETIDSSLCIQSPSRAAQGQGFSHKSYAQLKLYDKFEDNNPVKSRNTRIQEAKQQVEMHIQEVRRCRNKRNTKNEVKRIRKPRLDQSTVRKQGSSSKPRKGVKSSKRPPTVGSKEWLRWVHDEKARLEQHILEVRERRKRQQDVVHSTKSGRFCKAPYVVNGMNISSTNSKNNNDIGLNKLRIVSLNKVVNGSVKIETSEHDGKEKERGRSRGDERQSQRLLMTSSLQPVSWT